MQHGKKDILFSYWATEGVYTDTCKHRYVHCQVERGGGKHRLNMHSTRSTSTPVGYPTWLGCHVCVNISAKLGLYLARLVIPVWANTQCITYDGP